MAESFLPQPSIKRQLANGNWQTATGKRQLANGNWQTATESRLRTIYSRSSIFNPQSWH
jgi:hypothetical protein